MIGPMGYDKGTDGLRIPNEVEEVYDEKRGPLIGKRCVGNSTSGGCWYCIATSYQSINNNDKKIIYIDDCYCDWYRSFNIIGSETFINSCPMYSKKCL